MNHRKLAVVPSTVLTQEGVEPLDANYIRTPLAERDVGLGAAMTYISTYGTPNLYAGLGAVRAPTTLRASRTPAPTPIPPSSPTTVAKAAAEGQQAAKAAAVATTNATRAAKAAAAARVKKSGPPPWANPSWRRDGDAKVSKALSARMKGFIDSTPLSADKKSKLKSTPVSFLLDLAQNDRQAVSDFIHSARAAGAGVPPPAAGDNPATLAQKLVLASSTALSAAVKAAAEQATMAGFGAVATNTTTRTSFVGLAPALAAIAPLTLPVLQSISTSKPIAVPTKKAIDAAEAGVSQGENMLDNTPPAASAAADAAARSENLPRNLLIGGIVLGLGFVGWRKLKKKK